MELTGVDWSKLSKLYDDLDAQKKVRSSTSSGSSKSTWSPEMTAYCKNQIDGMWIREALYGVSRVNLTASDDHIAHIVLRLYVRKIVPFPRPFGLEGQLAEEVWTYMKLAAKEEHNKARRDICFEQEAWNRPSFTYVVKVEYYRPRRYHK
jgi:hypothetical protein